MRYGKNKPFLQNLRTKKEHETGAFLRKSSDAYNGEDEPENSYQPDRGTQTVMVFMRLDNLTEVLKDMTEEAKPHLVGALEIALTEWVLSFEGYHQRTGEGSYIVYFTLRGFHYAEKQRFTILEKIRDIDLGNDMPLTVSIGVGMSACNPAELGYLAQSALDLALERGGDQVVIKTPEKTRFFGGKSKGVEKRSKVRARVTALALKELIERSSQVVVMGHEMADYDSLGSALAVASLAGDLGKKACVIVDDRNYATDKLLAVLSPDISRTGLVKARDASEKLKSNTLLVVVDTHKPSLLPLPGLLKSAEYIAIIDHHRRGVEYIEDARLVYIESYASSTCELITELLPYFQGQVALGKDIATALLAGIIVDTQNFMLRTGVRTFEAASYLRNLGADPMAFRQLFQDDLATVIRKAEVLRTARVLYGRIALGVSAEKSADAQLMAAKTANTMLNIAGVDASFVLWPFEGGVAISARSNGEINVQIIMEKLNGGGHLTVAAAQVNDTIANTEDSLLKILEESFR